MASNPFLSSPFAVPEIAPAATPKPVEASQFDEAPAQAPARRGMAPTKQDLVARAQQMGVDPALALSFFTQESSGNWNSKDSPKGARGGMQVMPGTYKAMMGTSAGQTDPWMNMEAGLRYIAYGQKKLGTNDPELLAAGYHAGYDRKDLKAGRIPGTNDGIISTADYARSVAARVRGSRQPASRQPNLADQFTDTPEAAVSPSASDFVDSLEEAKSAPQVQAAPVGQAAVIEPVIDIENKPYLDRLAEETKSGFGDMARSLTTARWALGAGDAKSLAEDLAKSIREQGAKPKTKAQQEIDAAYQGVTDAKGVIDTTAAGAKALWASLTNPKETSIEIARNAANSLPTLAAGAAGAGGGALTGSVIPGYGTAAGAILGGKAGMALGTTATELGAEIQDMVQKRLTESKQPPTAQNVLAILSDKDFQSQALKQGAAKGLTVAAVDQLFMGLGGKIATAPARKVATQELAEQGMDMATRGARNKALASPAGQAAIAAAKPALGARVGAGAAAVGVDAAGESLGEGLSQQVARGEVDYGEALREGVVSIGQSAAQTAVGATIESAKVAARAAKGAMQPTAAAPSTASGPLGRATENAAAEPERVTVTAPDGQVTGTVTGQTDGGVQVVGDDGQVYHFATGPNGVQITPEAPNTPLSNAVEVAAGETPAQQPQQGQPVSETQSLIQSLESVAQGATGDAKRNAVELITALKRGRMAPHVQQFIEGEARVLVAASPVRGPVETKPAPAPAAAPAEPESLTPQQKQEYARAQAQSTPVADPLGELQGRVRTGTQYTGPQDVRNTKDAVENAWLDLSIASDNEQAERDGDAVQKLPTDALRDRMKMVKAEIKSAGKTTETSAMLRNIEREIDRRNEAEKTGQSIEFVDSKLRSRRIRDGLQNILDTNASNTVQILKTLDESLQRIGESGLSEAERTAVVRVADAYFGFRESGEAAPLPQTERTLADTGADNASMEALIPERGSKKPQPQAKPKAAPVAKPADFADTKAEALAAPEAAPVTQPAPPVATTEEGAGASKPPQAAPVAEAKPKDEPAATKPEDAGRQAFAAGQDRTPPQNLPPNGKKKWLDGWDASNLEAPVEMPTKAPILQNRNRSNPSSIAQMQSIAGSPDYGRLGFSRDFANGAPVVAGGTVPVKQMGREDVAVAADGRRIPVQYAAVEAADVLPSNRADGTPNADYGNQDVQRLRAIAGNGRIAGMQEAYRKGTAGAYVNELSADLLHGVSPDVIRAMREPVLVRVMPDNQVTADIGDVSNTTGNLSLSAVEQANNDAERVSLDALQFAEDGSITAEAVRQFVRAMPQAEQGGLIDTNGQPTRQAVDRLNAAVFAKAYGNDELVRLYSQAQDPEARLILSALAQVAPKMARLDGAGALDIRSLVTQAAEIAVTARRKGVALARAAQQLDMAADPAVSVFLDLFAANPRNSKPIVEALGNAADFAYTEANKPAEDMFGAVPRADRADVINRLRPENERASQKDLEVAAGGQPAEVDAGRAEAQAGPRGSAAPTEEGGAGQAQGLTAELPAKVKNQLDALLRPLKDASNELQAARQTDEKFRGDGRYAAELMQKVQGRVDAALKKIEQKIGSIPNAENQALARAYVSENSPDLTLTAPERRYLDDLMSSASATSATQVQQGEPLLTAPTPDDIVARQEAAEAAQREKEAADRKAAEAEDKRRERDEVRRRSEAAADTFELGQDPMANLTGQKDIFSAPAETAPAAYGSTNKLVTADRAAELRKRLKAKLSGSQLNSGIDPEILAIGAELAVFHIEAGVRKFTDFAKVIAADLDVPMEKVRPYLRSWYNGARDMMEDADVSIDGMDDPNVVRREWRQMGEANQDAPMAQENDNVPSADASVEPDRQEPASEPTVGDAVPADTRGTAGANGRDGGQAAGGSRRGQPRADGLSSGGAAADGNRGDFLVPGGDATADAASVAAGADFSERGGDIGLDGVSVDPIPAAQVDAVAEKVSDGLAKQQKQKAAEKITVKPGDLANVKATLPYLLDGQQEDVFKAETRFAQPDGYGMLFTNGTGTGKTFTGLGTVKRMQRQGKTNILIVVPDDKIAADWIESGEPLGLKISKLKDTKDAGTGIVVTSYANLGENDALANRQWDMVVADEAHTLMQSADGTTTKYLANLRAITHHPDGATQRYTMLNRADIERLKAVSEQMTANDRVISDPDTMDVMVADRRKQNEALNKELRALRDKLDAEQKKVRSEVAEMQGAKRARLLALSATPFAYEFTVDWANGYLFDYNEGQTSDQNEFRGYNQGSNRDRFFMTHFGYSMRTNKLTKPDPSKVDTGLLQRNFNGWLRKKGALSARMLDVPADYDRRFVLVDSGIGNQIDDALNWISEKSREGKSYNGYSMLRQVIDEKFDHLSRSYLLEAIKANEVVPIVRQHMKLGRKIVVFHDYKKGGGFNPFDIPAPGKPAADATPEQVAVFEDYKAAVMDFRTKFKGLVNAPLSQLDSPIEVFQREIPGVMLVNGDVKPKKDLLERYKRFQDDASGPQVMLVQSAKNKGWSGHDATGKHQRVLINLGQPTAPTLAIQQEGRIYRTGQVTDAIMRYLNTGTTWEKMTFASTIAGRASTAENLGMGEQARALKDSFVAAFEESDAYPPGHEGEGKGGKERDKMANSAITAYDRAKTYYWATQKKNNKTKAQEGTDYFATPEPVGFKMAEWLGLRGGESSLEPSAGHGAIARWLPEITNRTVIEPSNVLRARLAMAMDAGKDRIIDGTFENHAIVNKYDGIAMNPPFGVGGKTAIEHLAKAAGHLRDGGRIVALIPTGPAADKRFDQWMYGETERQAKPLYIDPNHGPVYKGDTLTLTGFGTLRKIVVDKVDGRVDGPRYVRDANTPPSGAINITAISKVEPTGQRTETYRASEGLYTVADIKLPQVTFERAGTAVATRIVVLEKQADSKRAPNARRTIDLSSITDIKELFDRIEDLSVPERTMTPEQQAADKAAQEEDQRQAKKAEAKSKPKAANPDAVGTVDRNGEPIIEHVTAKGKTLRGIVRTDLLKEEALAIDPYTLRKNGGWFIREVYLKPEGDTADEAPAMSRAELEPIFEALEGRGLARKRALDSLANLPEAAKIEYIENNFVDILEELNDSNLVDIKC